jgi:hypothetical protein
MEFIITERTELCISVSDDTLEKATEKAQAIPRDHWLGSHYSITGKTQAEFDEENIECFGKTLTLEEVIKLTTEDARQSIKKRRNKT